jgi:hypothetical protein
MTATFQVGARYWAQSACDSNCIWWFTVTARTAKRVTLLEDSGDVHVRGVKTDGSGEWVLPFGTYSMAPVIRAWRTEDHPSAAAVLLARRTERVV